MKTETDASHDPTPVPNLAAQVPDVLIDQVVCLLRRDQGMPYKKLCSSVRFRADECEAPATRSEKAHSKRAAKAKRDKRRQSETPTTSDPVVLRVREGPSTATSASCFRGASLLRASHVLAPATALSHASAIPASV